MWELNLKVKLTTALEHSIILHREVWKLRSMFFSCRLFVLHNKRLWLAKGKLINSLLLYLLACLNILSFPQGDVHSSPHPHFLLKEPILWSRLCWEVVVGPRICNMLHSQVQYTNHYKCALSIVTTFSPTLCFPFLGQWPVHKKAIIPWWLSLLSSP